LQAGRWIITRHRAVKSNLIVTSHGTSHGVWRGGSLGEEINVASFNHLREIDCHSIKELSRLRIGIHLLVTESRDTCRGVKKLCDQQNEQDHDPDRDQKFRQGKSGFGSESHALSCQACVPRRSLA
jgi:hypothetical protein